MEIIRVYILTVVVKLHRMFIKIPKAISLSIRLISSSFENLDKSNGNLLNLLFDKLMEESEFVWDKNKF
jgi:hypothetical protein